MNAWAWTGEAYEPRDSLPVEDRGFRYGMSLFESLRVWQRKPLFLDEHLSRLRAACTEREFPAPAEALSAVGPLLRTAGKDGFARIYVTAGDGSVGAPPANCRVLVMLEEREHTAAEPCSLLLPHETHRPLFGGLKTGNYWANVDALQRAQRAGHDETLLFNDQAELISVCTANIFVVHRGTMRTPALACGARNGVMREWVLKQKRAQQGSLFVEDLQTADEVFLTNSWTGLRPVKRIGERELPSMEVCNGLAGIWKKALANMVAFGP